MSRTDKASQTEGSSRTSRLWRSKEEVAKKREETEHQEGGESGSEDIGPRAEGISGRGSQPITPARWRQGLEKEAGVGEGDREDAGGGVVSLGAGVVVAGVPTPFQRLSLSLLLPYRRSRGQPFGQGGAVGSGVVGWQ